MTGFSKTSGAMRTTSKLIVLGEFSFYANYWSKIKLLLCYSSSPRLLLVWYCRPLYIDWKWSRDISMCHLCTLQSMCRLCTLQTYCSQSDCRIQDNTLKTHLGGFECKHTCVKHWEWFTWFARFNLNLNNDIARLVSRVIIYIHWYNRNCTNISLE